MDKSKWLRFVLGFCMMSKIVQEDGAKMQWILRGSSEYGFINKDYTFECVTGSDVQAVRWFKDNNSVAITTRNKCSDSPGSNPRFRYSCDGDKFRLTIPAESLTDEINGSTWTCADPTGKFNSKQTKLFIQDLSGCEDKSDITGIPTGSGERMFQPYPIINNETETPFFKFIVSDDGVQSQKNVIDDLSEVTIKTESGMSTFSENDNIIMTCTLGSSELLNISWTFTSEALVSDSNVEPRKLRSPTLLKEEKAYSDGRILSSSWLINKAQCKDIGTYACLFSTNSTHTVSNNLSIYITCTPRIRQIKQVKNPMKVKTGEDAEFSISVIAYPKPNITWSFPQKHAHVTNKEYMNYVYQHESSLKVTNIQRKDFGKYAVVATNKIGSDEYEFILTEAEPDDLFAKIGLPITAAAICCLFLLTSTLIVVKMVAKYMRQDTTDKNEECRQQQPQDPGNYGTSVVNNIYASAEFDCGLDNKEGSNSLQSSYESVWNDNLHEETGIGSPNEDDHVVISENVKDSVKWTRDSAAATDLKYYDRKPVPVPRRTMKETIKH